MPVYVNSNPAKMLLEYRKLKSTLPRRVGAEATRFFKESFRWQGFKASMALTRWPARKAGARRNKGRALLVQSGRLRRSIRVIATGTDYVRVGTDVPYARVHNEGGRVNAVAQVGTHQRRSRKGGKHTVKAHSRRVNFQMPKRQFMGDSPFFNNYMINEIRTELERIFQKS